MWNKPLPSWEDNPTMNEDEYYSVAGFYSDKGVKQRMPETSEARNEGYTFGASLSSLFVTRPDHSGYSKLVSIARQFAKWAGYRTLDEGSEYMDGFVDGFFSQSQKLITEEKEK